MDNTSDVASEREEDSGIESSVPDPADSTVYIRIAVPELKTQKCLQFHQDDTVWTVKQQVLATMAKDLKDGMNFGLYCPPMNGRAGKFLDEQRPLRDYPLPGPIGFLEFKYKRRVYKLMQLNPRKLRQLHVKTNLKQFVEAVRSANLEKITKFTNRGLDPNFHDHDIGETPLSIATTLKNPRNVMIALVSGGAHLDYRSKDGTAPMHRAAARGNLEAQKTLLDLGASPNVKDKRGLSPVYHAVCNDTSAHCVELLLHDHALLGVQDDRGSTEVHQACKYGRVQHLEHLLFYGAEMNSQNASGNSPLHVCAVNDQESCARVLLFRGADKTIQNYANQDSFEVAVIAGNTELAEIIKTFRPEDVVPFQEVPKYNEKRRGTQPILSNLQRSRSDPRLNLSFANDGKPPSPCLSNNSLPHYMSNGNIFDPSNAGMLFRHGYDSDSPRSMSISSAGSVSGRGSTTSDSPLFTYSRQRLYPALPGRSFICIKNFKPTDEAELAMKKGQFVQVLSVGEGGYWEGKIDNQEGWFPSSHVQEIQMRRKGFKGTSVDDDSILVKRQTLAALVHGEGENAPRTVVLQKGRNGFGFVLRGAKSQAASGTSTLDFSPTADFPALQYLDRVDKTSMADRAGLKPGDFLLEINGENVVNATHERTVQLIKSSGDTLAMKVVTVKPLSYEGMEREMHVDGTRTLPLKKKGRVTANKWGTTSRGTPAPAPPKRDPHTSLSAAQGLKARSMMEGLAVLEESNLSDEERLDHPRMDHTDTRSIGQMSDQQLNAAAARSGVDANNKTASIRTRHSKRLVAVELENIFSNEVDQDGSPVVPEKSYSNNVPRTYASPAEMKRAANGRANGRDNSNLARARSSPSLVQDGHRVLSPSNSQDDTYSKHIATISLGNEQNTNVQNGIPQTRVPNGQIHTVADVHHYTPPNSRAQATGKERLYASPNKGPRRYGSVENLIESRGTRVITNRSTSVEERRPIPPHPREAPPVPPNQKNMVIPPPPTHAPPTPPTPGAGEVVPIVPTYANISAQIQAEKAAANSSAVESSFRPGIGARFSKEPAVLPSSQRNHSRTPSVSSGSSHHSHQSHSSHHSHHSDQHLPVAQVVERFDQEVRAPSVERPTMPNQDDKVYRNATQFIREHPNANVLVTAETSSSNTQRNVTHGRPSYEPAPDYDQDDVEPSGVKTEVPSVQSVREAWAARDSPGGNASISSTTSSLTPSPQTSTPVSRQMSEKEEEQPSAFGNAIKMAAQAREKRVQESPGSASPQTSNPASGHVQRQKPPAPPPPPPPPQASVPPPPPPLQNRELTPPVRQSPPAHVQKKLEETRKRDESHAQLLAAVARRRNIVENADSSELATNIDQRVTRAKKLQSTVYKSDQSKEEVSHSPAPVAPLLSHSRDASPATRTPPVVAQKRTEPAPATPPAPQKTPEDLKASESNGQTDFLAMAEKARQDWLLKRAASNAGTLERKPVQQRQDSQQQEQQEQQQQSPPRAAPPPPPTHAPPPPPPEPKPNDAPKYRQHHPQPKPPAQRATPPQDKSSGLGDLASIIARKALERQKSADNVLDGVPANNNNNESKTMSSGQSGSGNSSYVQGTKLAMGPSATHTVFDSRKQVGDSPSSVRNVASNFEQKRTPGINKMSPGQVGNKTVEIKGATVDYSYTEAPSTGHENQRKVNNEQDDKSISVAAKTKMFESQVATKPVGKNGSGKKTINSVNGKSSLPFELPPPVVDVSNGGMRDDVPPPMVPPPPNGFNGDQTNYKNGFSNGRSEPVGWVINSNPAHPSHEYAIRSKLAQQQQRGFQSHMNSDHMSEAAIADIVEVEVIPPPPFFETEETIPQVVPPVYSGMHGNHGNIHDDNSSMVSSLSTLSTLSSCEHEGSLHDSPRHSTYGRYDIHNQSHIPIPEEKGYEEIYHEIAPPPPGFDDTLGLPSSGYVHMSSEPDHHYEELPVSDQFIPPPMEFGVAPQSQGPVTSLRNALKSGQVPSRQTFQNKTVNTWTSNDVGDWLDSVQLGQHRNNFVLHNIDGQRLPNLGRNELLSLGVTQVGDRMSLERAIKRLTLNS